jgi:NADH-quinone oxidoreductase subunit G
MIPHLSTAKSPHMMEGALVKAFFSTTLNRSASELDVDSIMPCVRKQAEADRLPFHAASGAREVDHVINTRELAAIIKASIKLEPPLFTSFLF